MILKVKKPYKANRPEDTILNISTILNKKLGILLKVIPFGGENGLFSCRISIANNNLMPFEIGTHGKGMKFEYALASAYGEFIERIQTLKLISHRNFGHISRWKESDKSEFYKKLENSDLILKYKYAPDEENIIFSKGSDLLKNYINPHDIEEIEEYYIDKSITLLPFYSVFEDEVINLPYEIIEFSSSTNGVCAGNTPQEALLHGLSEILERYALKLLYKENMVFPTIPKSHFIGTNIYNIIDLLEKKNNWKIEIKDCSCNLGLPVIGILIIDSANHKYKFHLGADPSPITALERSLTELYEMKKTVALLPIDIRIQTQLLTDNDLKEIEFFKSHNVNMGYHHINIFSKNSSYEFNGFNENWGISDEADLKLMISILKKINVNIYIRDVSFLGFPSYFIYIPNISECKNQFTNDYFKNHIVPVHQLQMTFRNISTANHSDIKGLLRYMSYENSIPLKRFYNTHDIWNYYNSSMLLSLLYNYINDKDNAIIYIQEYINSLNNNSLEYNFFSCFRDSLIYDGSDKEEFLSLLYPAKLVSEVLNFSKDGNFFSYLNHSNCFECEDCKIKKTCFLFDSLRLCKKIENEYIKNVPDQYKLAQLFIH